LTGPDTSKSNLETIITTLKDGLTNQYGAVTRMYILKNVNNSVDLVIEGDNLFASAPKSSLTDQINSIIAWIKSNLVIVVPVAVVVGLLLVYKLWYDSRHSGDKQVIAGVKDDDDFARQAVRPRNKSRRNSRDHNLDDDRQKQQQKKKKRPVEKKRKDRDHRQGEQEMENEFGVRVVRKGGGGHNEHANAHHGGSDEHLPPNWTVAYYDDGAKFYFNSATNDIAHERPLK